jgi:hypothetical protein
MIDSLNHANIASISEFDDAVSSTIPLERERRDLLLTADASPASRDQNGFFATLSCVSRTSISAAEP